MAKNDQKYWLAVERLENWRVDQAEGFKRFGIPERKRRLAEGISAGDILITYVSSGRSSFADSREITFGGSKVLRLGGDYDTAFPFCLETKPKIVLDESRWVPVQPLSSKLRFLAGKADWRQSMRTTLRELAAEDARIILSEIEKRSKLLKDATHA